MDVNIDDKSNWQKSIEVQLSNEELEPDFEKAYREYKKKITLGGFRKGKVPITLIKQIYGKEIQPKIAQEKIPDIIADISKENKFQPISPAKIEDISYSAENGLKFKALLEIVPQIELQNYKGLSIEKEVYQVSQEDVEDALENLREQNAIMINIEDEAKLGHYIIADLQKLDQSGVPVIGEKYEDREFQLNGEKEDELSRQLLGVKVGDIRTVQLTSINPQNQQPIVEDYSVTIKEIKQKNLAEVDDEFAKDMGDFENLEELKAKLKEQLEYQFKDDYERIFSQRLVDELVKSNDFEVPEPMVSNYLELVIEKMKQQSQDKEIDEQQIRQNYRADTIWRIKWSMIRDKICELEQIEVSDSEVDDYIAKLANADSKNSVNINNYYRQKENRNQLKNDLLDDKAIQFLSEHADKNEKLVSRKDLMKEQKVEA